MHKKQSNFFSLLPLLMVILLDVAGIILVLPVLTPLILQPNLSIMPVNTPLIIRDFFYGFSLAVFPLFMFFSTPILGELSDRFGRKKILLLCLIVSALSYIVGALGIIFNSLFIFLASRALAGLAAGTQPIASAAIIDMSTPQNKTKNLAWIVFASSIGLIIGPILGGFTAEKNLVSWFSYQTPFFIAAIVLFFNALMLQLCYVQPDFCQSNAPIQITKGFRLFLTAFTQKKFSLLSFLYFCFILAWSLYYQTINWFFMEKYHYTVGQLGAFVAFIGVIFAFMSSIGVRVILKLFSNEVTTFTFFILMMAIANIGAAMSQGEISQWLWVILNATGDVVCFTTSLAIFSNLTNKESQGWIMGVTGAIGAMTWTVGGMIAGPLGYVDISLPLWVAGGLCLMSFILIIIYQRIHK